MVSYLSLGIGFMERDLVNSCWTLDLVDSIIVKGWCVFYPMRDSHDTSPVLVQWLSTCDPLFLLLHLQFTVHFSLCFDYDDDI